MAAPLLSARNPALNLTGFGLPGSSAPSVTSVASTPSTQVMSRPSSSRSSQQRAGAIIATASVSIVVQARPAELAYTFPVSIYPLLASPTEGSGEEADAGEEVSEAAVGIEENKVKSVQGSHLEFSVSPALPQGLVLDSDSGSISGAVNCRSLHAAAACHAWSCRGIFARP